jgi:hypothetical protein
MTERLPDNLIRLYCDGELAEHEAAEVRLHLAANPAERDRVEFERRLKSHAGQVMQVKAPAGLAESVRAAMTLSAGYGDALGAAHRSSAPARAQTRSPGEASDSRWNIADWFAGPKRVNVFAVAACLMLVGGVVLIGIYGPTIDQVPRDESVELYRNAALLTEAAQFATREHGRCALDTDAARIKLKCNSFEDAQLNLRSHVGAVLPAEFDLSRLGYEFVCGGPCAMPPQGFPSGQLLFRKTMKDGRSPCVSVFFEPDEMQYAYDDGQTFQRLKPGVVYSFPSGCSKGIVMSDGRMVYLMTACRAEDLPILQGVLEQAGWAGQGRPGSGR